MIKFVVTFVFEQQWWAVTVQTFPKLRTNQTQTHQNTLIHLLPEIHKVQKQKKGGTEGTESSSFWLHHCVKCQRKQDACLSF